MRNIGEKLLSVYRLGIFLGTYEELCRFYLILPQILIIDLHSLTIVLHFAVLGCDLAKTIVSTIIADKRFASNSVSVPLIVGHGLVIDWVNLDILLAKYF